MVVISVIHFWEATFTLVNFPECMMIGKWGKIRPSMLRVNSLALAGVVTTKSRKPFLVEARHFFFLTKLHETKNKSMCMSLQPKSKHKVYFNSLLIGAVSAFAHYSCMYWPMTANTTLKITLPFTPIWPHPAPPSLQLPTAQGTAKGYTCSSAS